MEPGTPYESNSGLLSPPTEATGLSAMRPVRGVARNYTAIEFTRGWNGVEHFIRTLMKVGYIAPSSSEPSYAVLDVLDAEGDIIGDYNVPNARAFAYIKRKLQLRVEHEPETA